MLSKSPIKQRLHPDMTIAVDWDVKHQFKSSFRSLSPHLLSGNAKKEVRKLNHNAVQLGTRQHTGNYISNYINVNLNSLLVTRQMALFHQGF